MPDCKQKSKIVRPGTLICDQISVDKWTNVPGSVQHSFLSHAHSDHMSGLKPHHRRIVYCTEVTAKLVAIIFRGQKTDIQFRHVDIGKTYNLQCGSVFNPDGQVKVTVLDAFHCAGSAMFLFEGAFGRILYTGDIRIELDSPIYESERVGEDERLDGWAEVMSGKVLDCLHLDNTYLGQTSPFPPRDEMAQRIMDLIESHPDSAVFIVTYRIGKEALFKQISTSLRTPILVSEERREFAIASGYESIITTDPEKSRIRIINLKDMSKEIREFRQRSQQKILCVIPSAHPVLYPERFPWFNNYNSNPLVQIEALPYSDHSSHEELEKFLRHLKIRKLLPVSKAMSEEETKKYLCQEQRDDKDESRTDDVNESSVTVGNKGEEDSTSQNRFAWKRMRPTPVNRSWLPPPRKRSTATGLPMTPSPDFPLPEIQSRDSSPSKTSQDSNLQKVITQESGEDVSEISAVDVSIPIPNKAAENASIIETEEKFVSPVNETQKFPQEKTSENSMADSNGSAVPDSCDISVELATPSTPDDGVVAQKRAELVEDIKDNSEILRDLIRPMVSSDLKNSPTNHPSPHITILTDINDQIRFQEERTEESTCRQDNSELTRHLTDEKRSVKKILITDPEVQLPESDDSSESEDYEAAPCKRTKLYIGSHIGSENVMSSSRVQESRVTSKGLAAAIQERRQKSVSLRHKIVSDGRNLEKYSGRRDIENCPHSGDTATSPIQSPPQATQAPAILAHDKCGVNITSTTYTLATVSNTSSQDLNESDLLWIQLVASVEENLSTEKISENEEVSVRRKTLPSGFFPDHQNDSELNTNENIAPPKIRKVHSIHVPNICKLVKSKRRKLADFLTAWKGVECSVLPKEAKTPKILMRNSFSDFFAAPKEHSFNRQNSGESS